MAKRGGPSLHSLIMREAASTGRVKESPLTPAQREMLERLAAWGPGPADPTYGPGKVLLRLGYATKEVRRNKMRLHIFAITEAGRAALSPNGEAVSAGKTDGDRARDDH